MREKAIGVVSRDRLAQLLHGPLSSGVRGHVAVQEAPCRVFHDHKNIQEVKGRRDDHAKVACDNGLGMVTDKGGPALGGHAVAWTSIETLRHIPAHGPWRHPQAKLEQQLISDALLAPRRILPGHLADQGLQLTWNAGATRSRFPTPEQAKSLAVPAREGLGLYHGQGLTPVEPTPEPDEDEASGRRRPSGFDPAFLIHGQLFTKKKVFCSQGRAWTQAETQETHAVVEEGQQGMRERGAGCGAGTCSVSLS